MNQMVNYIWLAWMLRTYRTCNSTVGFSKYELNNKLLGGVILFKVILNVTWTQPNPYIYICMYVCIYIVVGWILSKYQTLL